MKNSQVQPDISIITPVYNAARFLAETIDSVQNQSFRNWEYILVDDCSQDESVALIQSYQREDKRIKLIQLEENSGAAVARNTALEKAQGRYIAFIDSDDRWVEDKLAEQLTLMQTENYAFTYTNFALVSEDGSIIKEKIKLPAKLDYHGLLKNTAIACSTVMLDRQQVGDFRMPLVRKGQDTATWLQIMRTTGVSAYGLDRVLNYYRQVEGSISSNKVDALKRTWNTYRNLEQLPLYKCIYYFCHYVVQAILRRL
ncbi:glycosyltransferase family 2 protein [Fundicoccus culcitae]|uniref:Glycosyltransferase n=1 Tax=Fundicoccus culcitae TaxID=2969821 RepID=A0ABY5P626_9LACT|nr:glycosyltransferase family 2 protein [Fundicoccus culcitae]UUX33853.1 glycosyltransferase [Fundicoccus culcitae]